MVDCTNLPQVVREDLFMNSRDRMRECEERTALENSIYEYLKEHPGLREIKVPTGPVQEAVEYVGRQFPTYFRIHNEPKNGLSKDPRGKPRGIRSAASRPAAQALALVRDDA